MTDNRTDPDPVADERTTLAGFLDYHRETLALKCEGLTDEQLRLRAVPPSGMSLLGLVRHLTEVERGWFGRRVGGRDLPPLYFSEPDNPDGDFDDLDSTDVATVFATWRAACAESRDIVAASSLDATAQRRDGTDASVRWIMLHMLEEYARHNGHADFLRERIDGATGE
ncbi:DinB family protein [Umezawaea endophytica]|uniref:DinB family protein n=1 Tax=Umezawaea endophytica TaxID=1654476 RepID=A0A9X2VUR2_9PSEU|nr:DinB family protein [Umezawaea endophytica]MCS7482712.1 DinB family protein [Umezawaea endophytica]